MNKKFKRLLFLLYLHPLKFCLVAVFSLVFAKELSNTFRFANYHKSIYDLCDHSYYKTNSYTNKQYISTTDNVTQNTSCNYFFSSEKDNNTKESENLNKYSITIANSEISKYAKCFISLFGLISHTYCSLLKNDFSSDTKINDLKVITFPPSFIDKLRL